MGKLGVGVAFLTFVLVASAVHVAHGAGPLIAPDCATDAAALAAAKKRPTARPPVGNAEAGKKHWAFGNTSCLNCHGSDAQGAFAPTLAGRKLPFDVVKNQIRKPCGIMPAFIASQLTDQEIADMAAFWNSMPLPKNAAPWRVALPPGAPKGQELAIVTVGCAQCHLATVPTPRHGLAQVNGDWEWYKRQVYQHQTAIREQWRQLDPTMLHPTPGPAGPPGRDRVRMGHYDRTRLPESTLREIFNWTVSLGYLPPLMASMTPAGDNGASYRIEVMNGAVKNKGLAVEDVRVSIAMPADAKVVSATGIGYQGTQSVDAKTKTAVWRLPKLDAGARERLALTLAAPSANLRGTIRWGRPVVKADPFVLFSVTPAGSAPATN